nr:Lrp/AsnC ligand binding domain-containing protein [Nocardia arthritidis]
MNPGALERIARILCEQPQLRFVAATTEPSNLLVAVATSDLAALYDFLTGAIGALAYIGSIETTPSCTP